MDKFVGGLFRTKHKLMNKLGAAEITSDPGFDSVKDRFKSLESAVHHVIKDIELFHTALRDMTLHAESLARCVSTAYQGETDAPIAKKYRQFMQEHEAIKAFVEEAVARQQDSVIRYMKEYHGSFKELKDRISKRKDLIVDYDVLRERFESYQAAGETSKMNSAKEKMEKAQAEYTAYQDTLVTDLTKFCEQHPEKVDSVLSDILRTCIGYYKLCQEKYQALGEVLEVQITTPKIVEPNVMKVVSAPK